MNLFQINKGSYFILKSSGVEYNLKDFIDDYAYCISTLFNEIKYISVFEEIELPKEESS